MNVTSDDVHSGQIIGWKTVRRERLNLRPFVLSFLKPNLPSQNMALRQAQGERT
jgi:hypothetical protein